LTVNASHGYGYAEKKIRRWGVMALATQHSQDRREYPLSVVRSARGKPLVGKANGNG